MQAYCVIQNNMYLTIFGKDLKIIAIVLLMFLITFNIVSLAAIPITHQETILECRCV